MQTLTQAARFQSRKKILFDSGWCQSRIAAVCGRHSCTPCMMRMPYLPLTRAYEHIHSIRFQTFNGNFNERIKVSFWPPWTCPAQAPAAGSVAMEPQSTSSKSPATPVHGSMWSNWQRCLAGAAAVHVADREACAELTVCHVCDLACVFAGGSCTRRHATRHSLLRIASH